MDVKSQLKDAQLEHGTQAGLGSITPRVGRVLYLTDTKRIVFGDGTNWLTISGSPYIIAGTPADVTAGRADYGSIGDAISAASAGDKIILLSGTYNESFTVNKQLNIEGTGRATIINGTVTLDADGTKIQDLYINGQIDVTATTKDCILMTIWLSQFTIVNDLNTDVESVMLLAVREQT